MSEVSRATVIADTVHWVERVVIGLNLCPFAKATHIKGQIHYAVCLADTVEGLLAALIEELQALNIADSDKTDTTLLIHPNVLGDFLDYNDFLEVADAALVELKLDGVMQIASFHPQYQFADTAADDISNYTNRSPYPTLHLLREASVSLAVAAFPEASGIFEKNMAAIEALGHAGWERLKLKHVD